MAVQPQITAAPLAILRGFRMGSC